MSNGFVIKGNVCQTVNSKELDLHEKAFVVCEDGVSKGIFDTLPEEYAAFTMPGPPVARIRFTWGACISSSVPDICPRLRQPMLPLGAPACSAASATISAAFRVQTMALGWGEKTMGFPAFRAIMAL